MREAWRAKQTRRVANAAAKRDLINGEISKERFIEANTKIRRIRELSEIKGAQNAERRENAIRHQEMLKNFLDTEKANKRDERPLQYTEDADTTAFCPNSSRAFSNPRVFNDTTTIYESEGNRSRSFSRSPAPYSNS